MEGLTAKFALQFVETCFEAAYRLFQLIQFAPQFRDFAARFGAGNRGLSRASRRFLRRCGGMEPGEFRGVVKAVRDQCAATAFGAEEHHELPLNKRSQVSAKGR